MSRAKTKLAGAKPVATRNPLADLLAMLGTMRPNGSATERAFCRYWLAPLGAKPDSFGNWILDLPRADGADSAVLWSSHTDTVHAREGKQKIAMTNGVIELSPASIKAGSTCLGADCTTGAWIMREMAMARVPGLYIWHAAEECGGHGSSFIAKNPDKLDGIEYAIAFDRKGFDSIIACQAGGRCCSEAFSASLGALLPGAWRSDDGGTFTDTANYADLVGECTNVSVGYWNQHTTSEWQDVAHALTLRDAMLAFDETRLVSERKPGDFDEEEGDWIDIVQARLDLVRAPARGGAWREIEAGLPRCRTVADFVREFPDEAADLLESLGIGLADCLDHAKGGC